MEEYLKPGFDPRSLKVAQLRRILTENDVEFPSHSKKALLVRLFEERIKPKIPKLRKKHAKALSSGEEGVRTRASTRPRSGEVSDDSSKKTRKRRLGDSSSVKEEEEEEEGSGNGIGSDGDAEGDVNMDKSRQNSSAGSSSGKNKSRNKKRQRIGENSQNTPITEKVAKKSPNKSPRKSLVIDKFESSESSSESASTSTSFSNNQEAYISPSDLTHLRVSGAFASQLEKALRDEGKTEHVKSEPSDVSWANSEKDVMFDSPQRISTPELPSQRHVEETEDRVKELEKAQSKIEKGSPKVKTEPVEVQEPSNVAETSLKNEELANLENSEEKQKLQVDLQEPDVEEEEGKGEGKGEEEEEEKEIQLSNAEEESADQVVPEPCFWKRSFKFVGKAICNLLVFSFIMLPVLYGLWYRESRVMVGYCGQELPSPALPEQLGALPLPKPSCLPCPENSLCYPRMQLKCRPEYALKRNPWSLYGLLPLSDSCVKDSKREKLIAEVVGKSLQFLRVKNARVACGECNDDMKCGILEDELYQIFYESKAPWINDEEFDELWIQAVADLKREPEITWRQVSTIDFLKNFDILARTIDTNINKFWQPSESEYRILRNPQDQNETDDIPWKEGYLPKARNQTGIFRSTSKKYIGLRCKFEHEIYQTCYRNRKWILPVILGMLLGRISLSVNRKVVQERKQVDKLTRKVVDRLENAKKSEENEASFLSTVQLRDVLLSDIVDLKYKNRLWQKASKKLEHNNTNIKSSLMEIHGEIMKCWEWIGPLEDGEDNKDHEKK